MNRLAVISRPWARATSREAFTLVELLVSMAVLTLMVGLLSQALDATSSASHRIHQELNASDGTRRVLDSLKADLESMASANGVTLLVSTDTATSNTSLAFLTESRAPSGQSNVRFMAVAYSLNGQNLVRDVAPVLWTAPQLAGSTAAVATSGTPSILAPTSIRFQAAALLDNGTIVPFTSSTFSTAASWYTTTINGETLPSGWYGLVASIPPIDPNNPRVTGIVVGIATLDEQSILMGNASQMGGSLKAPTGSETPIDEWEADENTSSFLHEYPLPAIDTLSLGQQIYTLK